MHSGMIGKVEKAHRYSEQRERFTVGRLSVTVRGDNADHLVTLHDEAWQCECEFFGHHLTCAHTMALELVFEGMLPADQGARVA